MAYTTPYAELFGTRHTKREEPLGSLLLPLRARTPELHVGNRQRAGFYFGADLGLRFQWELPQAEASAVDTHSMVSGVVGAYYSGLNTPLVDRVDVSMNSLGRGIGIELTGSTLSHADPDGLSFTVSPKIQTYDLVPTEGRREWLVDVSLMTHWMFKRFMISLTPGFVRLPGGKALIGGNLNFPVSRGYSAFVGVPTNLPMKYQDVLPGAHPKPGAVEFGLAKNAVQFGGGIGKDGVYGLVRISVKPQQIGNREIRPQGDGHIMLSPEAEASHQGHGPNGIDPQTEVTITESVKVPPEPFLDLINDPFFCGQASAPLLR